MAGKLHELLAVEKGLEKTATEAIAEAENTFNKKSAHFMGVIKRYVPFEESLKETESTEEHVEMVDTVPSKLSFVFKHIIRWLDAVLQKEATNQEARADIALSDGTVLATDVPATFLLGLETKLKGWRKLIQATPTLSPGTKWVPDPQKGEHVYAAEHNEEKFRTKKVLAHKELVPATKEHPAQIEKWHEDQNVGKYITSKWCGMLSPADKSELLGRLDDLERAVKKARQRANGAKVIKKTIGKTLTDYLLTGETPAGSNQPSN